MLPKLRWMQRETERRAEIRRAILAEHRRPRSLPPPVHRPVVRPALRSARPRGRRVRRSTRAGPARAGGDEPHEPHVAAAAVFGGRA
jgi:hypothetical protein